MKKAKATDKSLVRYEFTKLNLKSKNSIYVILISKGLKPDLTKVDEYDATSNLKTDFTANNEIDIYAAKTGGKGAFTFYTKKKKS